MSPTGVSSMEVTGILGPLYDMSPGRHSLVDMFLGYSVPYQYDHDSKTGGGLLKQLLAENYYITHNLLPKIPYIQSSINKFFIFL